MRGGKKRSEEGVVVIEATYVVVVALLMIVFLMNAGVMYYNRMVVTAVADEAAASIANNYGAPGREPFYSYIAPEDYSKADPYRYLNSKKLQNSAEKKGKWYASYSLAKDEWNTKKRTDFSDVTVEYGRNDMGLDTVTVSIQTTYPVFVLNPMSFFGLDPQYSATAVGTAVCYDPIHEMNGVAFSNELKNKAIGMSKIAGMLDKALGIIQKIVNLKK